MALTSTMARPAGAVVPTHEGDAGRAHASALVHRPGAYVYTVAFAPPHARAPAALTRLAYAPPLIIVIIWFSKAMGATTFDVFIDYALATILALPPPGKADNVAVKTRIRYFVDNATQDVIQHLKDKKVEIVSNQSFLH